MSNVVAQLNGVLKKGTELGASDIHLGVGSLWKYRLNGHILPIKSLPKLGQDECDELVRHLILSANAAPVDEVDQIMRSLRDMDTSYSLPGISRFRVNICRQRGTFSLVLRVIPYKPPEIGELGLPEVIEKIAMEERGLILVTGITGSGKSTTLSAMINHINQSRLAKIVTIEDPIEFLHKEVKSSVIQREIGSDTDSFSDALRSALRQDPDVILVGEMRDRETIDIALKAAETGHLVLSTLHTVDAPKSIQRIMSVFELSEQKAIRLRLGETLRAVISQRLLRRMDQKGRVAVLEVMRHTMTIQDCIENPEKTSKIKDYIAGGKTQYGMQTFDQHLMDLFRGGKIDLETAKSAATSPADFERNVQFT